MTEPERTKPDVGETPWHETPDGHDVRESVLMRIPASGEALTNRGVIRLRGDVDILLRRVEQLERELSKARAALGPVTDEEWGSLKSSGIWGHTRDLIDAMLAKRRQGAGTWLTN